MRKRLVVITVSGVGAALLQACVVSNLAEYCAFPASQSLAEADSNTLGVVLGLPEARVVEAAYLMIYSPSMESQETAVRLNLISAAIPWPSELDETRCRDLDWRTYRVETDAAQWKAFWGRPRPFAMEMRLGFTDSSRQLPAKSLLPMRSFALAWVDIATSQAIMSCGCYEA